MAPRHDTRPLLPTAKAVEPSSHTMNLTLPDDDVKLEASIAIAPMFPSSDCSQVLEAVQHHSRAPQLASLKHSLRGKGKEAEIACFLVI